MHAFYNDSIDSINKDRWNDYDNATFDNLDLAETNIDPNVEPNVKPIGTTSGEPFVELHVNPTTKNPNVDIPVFYPYENEILDACDDLLKN